MLSDKRLLKIVDRQMEAVLSGKQTRIDAITIARAVEKEVRKEDVKLIRRLLEALEGAERDNHSEGISAYRAPIITAARARLEKAP